MNFGLKAELRRFWAEPMFGFAATPAGSDDRIRGFAFRWSSGARRPANRCDSCGVETKVSRSRAKNHAASNGDCCGVELKNSRGELVALAPQGRQIIAHGASRGLAARKTTSEAPAGRQSSAMSWTLESWTLDRAGTTALKVPPRWG